MSSSPAEIDNFTQLLVESQRKLYAYILTLIPNFADADDVLQETNAVLLRKRDEFEPGTSFGAWVCRVAYFEVLNFRKHRPPQEVQGGVDGLMLEQLSSSALAQLELEEARLASLNHCMERLSVQDRGLLQDRYFHDRSADEIAASVGRTPGAVRQVLYRIRSALLDCIEKRLSQEVSS